MAEARLGVLISGRGSNMAALLHASRLMADCPYEIVLVAANDPQAPGLAMAAAEGIATFGQSHQGLGRAAFDAIIEAELHRHGVTHVALAGYMRLLSPGFVERWAGRCFNIHPSLLPAHKGLHVHEAVLAAGETMSGCTVHLVTAELDGGPILGQARVAVLPGDTPESLAARILIAEHQLYPRVIANQFRSVSEPLPRLRALALALPEAAEKLSHGAPGFFVQGGKFFAYFSENHHGNGITALLVKASGVEEQAMLIEQDPELYFRPAYFGPAGWIGIRLDAATDWEMIGRWLERSWQASAPRRLLRLVTGQ
ncbi:formyltetrahydrofolate-dependent phosphoribosylglycinamide formyltransferase [Polymorphobacter multimanifer]|uniref:Phosphoribosylglycinamide formyltransferase n=1 Tax=Polymorphobacter multimanifer TaxID=1070431 RepID=A0A841L9Z2_9SPHN|nr:phosphoribosylglycinamide formyltransferase [Polymorphobacter multimanifer]MBB6225972.1 formyltetrahydrofolate-dependent phosphoribosylglycinamide formyltransferase [Polymorphobacter multimanifer]